MIDSQAPQKIAIIESFKGTAGAVGMRYVVVLLSGKG